MHEQFVSKTCNLLSRRSKLCITCKKAHIFCSAYDIRGGAGCVGMILFHGVLNGILNSFNTQIMKTIKKMSALLGMVILLSTAACTTKPGSESTSDSTMVDSAGGGNMIPVDTVLTDTTSAKPDTTNRN